MSGFVYVLRCADGTLYCGSTNDLEKRLYEHNHLKSGAKYTRGRRPVEFFYTEECATLNDARKREYEVKKMTRKQKESLSSSLNIKVDSE